MTKAVLRKQVHDYIDQVDDKFLAIVHQLLEREINSNEFDLSDEDIKLINTRKAELRSGKVKGIPHKKVIADLRSKLKKGK